ncbi:hypothetical protein NHH03_07280 [Stieleria sp. TO1_6]|uniref:hypothetical protein n=1 Tax=Stieleria tagensis TaxID=2956795 RepID=UPI00209B7570|nr:hypothetical protein [Stieleria tagensis]MCO8121532.1 hypothetical protein [Stieleria tagensis]
MIRIIALVMLVLVSCEVHAQNDEKPKDPVELILIAEDLGNATRLMAVYDLDEDGFVDRSELKRVSWREQVKDFDFNRDGKLCHLEVAVHEAKLRFDVGITEQDVNSAKAKLRRRDKNKNGQWDPEEIDSGLPNGSPSDYDRNHDGIVTLTELTHHFAYARGLRRELGIEAVDHSGAGYYFQKFDANKDGKLDSDEAAKTLLPMKRDDFDEDSDGMLTIVELETMLSKHRRTLGLTKTDQQQVNGLFRMYDMDADGRIPGREMQLSFGGRNPKQLTEYDADKDGTVTRSEVEKVFAEQRRIKGYDEQDYSKASKMMLRHDTNRSNTLEIGELFLSPETGQLPQTVMGRADLNQDRQISMDELAKYYAAQRR